MKKHRKRYERPKKPWSKERLDSEFDISKEYGLRRKAELWKVEARLREFRRRAREIVASQDKVEEKKLIEKVVGLGLVGKTAHLDDVLALTVQDLLDRRLQTIVHRKGIGSTQKQARQFITHGHIAIDGRRITWPSAFVTLEQEEQIGIYGNSKLKTSLVKLKNAAKKAAAKKKSKEDEEKKEGEAKPEEKKTEKTKKEEKTKKPKEKPKKEEKKPKAESKGTSGNAGRPKVVDSVGETHATKKKEKPVEAVEKVVEAVAETVKEVAETVESDVKTVIKEVAGK